MPRRALKLLAGTLAIAVSFTLGSVLSASAGGRVQAYAFVRAASPPVLLHPIGFSKVARVGPGAYCLTPPTGVTVTNRAVLVTPTIDLAITGGSAAGPHASDAPRAYVWSGGIRRGNDCRAGLIEVRVMLGDQPSNTVSFSIVAL